jgi:poly(3-hydroxybutyrate) depolymerase
MVAAIAEGHGCDPTPTVESDGAAETTRYGGCRDDQAVALVAVEGSGHVWPGSARDPDPDPAFDATAAVLDQATR